MFPKNDGKTLEIFCNAFIEKNQKKLTAFWRLSMEYDQYKRYSNRKREERKFLLRNFTRSSWI